MTKVDNLWKILKEFDWQKLTEEFVTIKGYVDILDNGTYGLIPIKNYVDLIDDGTYGLVSIYGKANTALTMLQNASYGLDKLRQYVDKIDDATDGLTNIRTQVVNALTVLNHATYGLEKIMDKANLIYTSVTSIEVTTLFGKVKKVYDLFVGLDDTLMNALVDKVINKVMDRFETVINVRYGDFDLFVKDKVQGIIDEYMINQNEEVEFSS